MKILTPLKGREYLSLLVESGAEELYLGYRDEQFEERFGSFTELNKMSSFTSANIDGREQAVDLCKKVKEMGADAFVTFNSVCYTPEQVLYIADSAELFKDVADGIIAADFQLISELDRRGIPVVVSTIAGIYNRYDIEFLRRFKNIKRIILPRELSLAEIESLSGIGDFEFEAFLMHNGCRFADSHCLGFHSRECGSVCAYLNNSNTVVRPIGTRPSFKEWSEFDLNHLSYLTYHREACGLCAIYRLFKAGVSAVKVVGRANIAEEIARSVRLVKQNIAIAKQCVSEREYLENMIFPEDRHTRCASGTNCYYPEVRFNG